ncbi:MAG: hypothetical protein JSW27_12855 [Phycisphaerales bacterium]|nr:MAG: hypothetical protein JSW27_12855 [Phycisphaerales bacterium]
MSVRANHFFVLTLCLSLPFALVLTGCCQKCGADRCTPRSLWQSPTVQVTRALLLVNENDLRILDIDGKGAGPTCVGEGQMQEFHLIPGEHTITAVFRRAEPRSEGFLADTHGRPLTHTFTLLAGHEYVALHREHPGPCPEDEPGVAEVATNVFNPPELYWRLEIVDLAEAGAESDPEVRAAQAYVDWLKDWSDTTGK